MITDNTCSVKRTVNRMKITTCFIKDIVIITPEIKEDQRGYFFESYNQEKLHDVLGPVNFIQDNESLSTKGVLRGLHYQKPPYAQAKLVRCIHGEVLDVCVDLRKDSKSFGAHHAITLSGENKKQIFIPRGFAHGFVVLSETALIAYKVDNIYAPKYDSGILWNDNELGIDWSISEKELFISEKDQQLLPLAKTDIPF